MDSWQRELLRERLLARRQIDPRRGCWLWTGSRDKNGYGHLRVGERVLLVHRVAAAVFFDHFDLYGTTNCLHSCDNPPCFNPKHLFAGTHADNAADRDAKRRRIAPRGSAIGTARLTEAQVARIIELLVAEKQEAEIAGQFGVAKTTVSRIARRQTWKHVMAEVEIPTGFRSGPKLRASDARKIRERLAAGVTAAALAREYAVDPSTISRIKAGTRW